MWQRVKFPFCMTALEPGNMRVLEGSGENWTDFYGRVGASRHLVSICST